MITSKSKLVRRGAGHLVVDGTVATASGLRIEITAVADPGGQLLASSRGVLLKACWSLS